MDRSKAVFCILLLSLFIGSASAADTAPTQTGAIQEKLFDPKAVPPKDVKPQMTNCYTNQAGCDGVAYFDNNGGSQNKACSVYFGNGAQGQSNFVMPPNQWHGIHVRTGDTYACVWGNNQPPNNAQRSYIFVR